jgi:hypothetical protein
MFPGFLLARVWSSGIISALMENAEDSKTHTFRMNTLMSFLANRILDRVFRIFE